MKVNVPKAKRQKHGRKKKVCFLLLLCCCLVLSPRRERYRRQETRDKRDRKLERERKAYCIDFSDNKSDSDNSYELLKLREQGVERREEKKRVACKLE